METRFDCLDDELHLVEDGILNEAESHENIIAVLTKIAGNIPE